MRFVTLANVADSYQAFFIKEELASEGIECMVVNENAAILMQQYGSIGQCVLIRVLDTDYVAAKTVVDKMKVESVAATCLNCGSTNVGYGTGVKNTLRRVFFVLTTFMYVLPGRFLLTHRCNDCGYEFRKNAL